MPPLPISAEHPVLVAVGTRPEVIKLAPVVFALRERAMPTFLLSTGQHREMLAQILDVFDLAPDRDLAVMRPDQSLASLSASLLAAADPVLGEVQPSWVVVQGDTTTVAMMALAAFYRQIPVAHVEAGLRTHLRYDPFPEEMNRSLLARLGELHFAPTETARANLLAEGVLQGTVHTVGNSVVDALHAVAARVADRSLASFGLPDPEGRKIVLVTGHRRENFGQGMRDVCLGLRRLAEALPREILIVYPVHLNPNVRRPVAEILGGVSNIALIEPLAYDAFVKLLTSATLAITDSGGVQEEAASLGVPLLVTRRTSERPEALQAGVGELVGTEPDRIVATAHALLTDAELHAQRAVPTAVFGDGRAAARIADHLLATAAARAPKLVEVTS